MAVIFTGSTDQGEPYPPLQVLADTILEACPGETIRYVKGSTSGIMVSERGAVAYLMQRYTTAGNPRKGKSHG